ncbi:lysylphosphatidylglycerol synthase domain-containing protein [Emticicia sp. BO119]|uniref:lysylphosphatidylglycerol synthase domain-containing protein n=1 Tax=Emticicia sp. BO119 TaxID=2757768 RepID=UPI0015F121C4|nr:lysylphosphatidylglycerol synthase domain-containing protein [Emticicia sp. BO119]MBA4852246.1 flippase-like domain-containing protein [Emticicia sp. BO119]
MQINSKISDFTAKQGFRLLKNILFAGVLYAVYILLKEKGEGIEEVFTYFRKMPMSLSMWIILLLIPVNWAFEAWKWQRLAAKIEKISFREAYQGVLAGLALANFTPMMIGDYAGKILMLKTRNRTASIGAILLGNGMQLYVSLLFGAISYGYFLWVAKPEPFILHISIVELLFVLLLTGLWIAFNLQKLNLFNSSNKYFNSINQYLTILKDYSLSEIRYIFLIAASRYAVFSIQFLLVLQLFQIDLPMVVLLVGVGIVFLTKTLGAAFNFLGDLSMRAITSVYYFGYFGVRLSLITTATFTIWLINVLVPVIIGSMFILTLRLSTRNLKTSTK